LHRLGACDVYTGVPYMGAFAGCSNISSTTRGGFRGGIGQISWFYKACRKYGIQMELVKRLQREADGEAEQSEASDGEEIVSMDEALKLDENPFSLRGMGRHSKEHREMKRLQQKWKREKDKQEEEEEEDDY